MDSTEVLLNEELFSQISELWISLHIPPRDRQAFQEEFLSITAEDVRHDFLKKQIQQLKSHQYATLRVLFW